MDFKINGKSWHIPKGVVNITIASIALSIGIWIGDIRADVDCNKENTELRIENIDLKRQLDDCQTV